MPEPNWTAVLSALLTPVVAVFASVIGYRQWKTARDRLKLDLFDRRVKVYDAAREFISSIMTSGKVSSENEFKFLSNTRGALWLFDQSIVDYPENEIWHRTCELYALHAELDGEPAGEARTKNLAAQREIKNWLTAQLRIMEQHFAPYLKLRH